MTMMLLTALEQSPHVNVRAEISGSVVKAYSEDMQAGDAFPPVVVFCEPGCQRYILADGRHRVKAAELVGLKKINVEVKTGTEVDALKYALHCNLTHGRRRTSDDLRIAYAQLQESEALTKKYRTRKEHAALLGVGLSTAEVLDAEWRKSESTSDEQKKLKAQRRANAKKHTTKGNGRPTTPVLPDDPEGFDLDAQEFVAALNLIASSKVKPEALIKLVHGRTVAAALEKLDKLADALEEKE